MKLSNLAQGRDNNFNLLRITAALAVLLAHSFPLTLGAGVAVPGRRALGMSIASVAVDAFFVTSGFLVTGSLLRTRSVLEFTVARVLRIFPALLVVTVLTVFGLGLLFTTWSWAAYLADPRTYRYLIKSSTLFFGVSFDLPGVFDGNPYKAVVNGSLWTLPHEVHVYAILAVVWLCARVTRRSAHAFSVATVGCAAVGLAVVLARHFYAPPRENGFSMLFYMFFAGAACFVMRDRIVLSRSASLAIVAALLGCALIPRKDVFFVVYTVSLPYLLLVAAYVPSGSIRQYNRLGDYSYGVYILAFPVEQSIAALVHGISPPLMAAAATVSTLSLAALSWHLIERPALDFKARYLARAPRARMALSTRPVSAEADALSDLSTIDEGHHPLAVARSRDTSR